MIDGYKGEFMKKRSGKIQDGFIWCKLHVFIFNVHCVIKPTQNTNFRIYFSNPIIFQPDAVVFWYLESVDSNRSLKYHYKTKKSCILFGLEN